MAKTETYLDRVLRAFNVPEESEEDYRILREVSKRISKAAKFDYRAARKMFHPYFKTTAFTGANNVAVARAARVNPDWLATGEGEMQEVETWPFPYVKRDRFDKLATYARFVVQKAMNDALEEIERGSLNVGEQAEPAETKDLTAGGEPTKLQPKQRRGGAVRQESPLVGGKRKSPAPRKVTRRKPKPKGT